MSSVKCHGGPLNEMYLKLNSPSSKDITIPDNGGYYEFVDRMYVWHDDNDVTTVHIRPRTDPVTTRDGKP